MKRTILAALLLAITLNAVGQGNLQIRRYSTTSGANSYTPEDGEPIFDKQAGVLRVGDGSTAGGIPVGGGDMGTATYDTDSDSVVDYAESVSLVAQNETGVTISAGTVVYVDGYDATSGLPTISPADADSASTMPAIGIVPTAINHNASGKVIIQGVYTGNTSAFTIGDVLYVSGTAGSLTTTRPTGTALPQRFGIVTKVHASTGTVHVTGPLEAANLPNLPNGQIWVGNGSAVPTGTTLNGAAVVNTPAGNIAATTTQAAINELDSEKESATSNNIDPDRLAGDTIDDDILDIAAGGTGGNSASTARTALGLAIGTDVQAYSANLAALASAGSSGSGTFLRSTLAVPPNSWLKSGASQELTAVSGIAGSDIVSGQVAIANGGTGASTASGARTALGLVIGTDVLAPNGDGSALTVSNDGYGSGWDGQAIAASRNDVFDYLDLTIEPDIAARMLASNATGNYLRLQGIVHDHGTVAGAGSVTASLSTNRHFFEASGSTYTVSFSGTPNAGDWLSLVVTNSSGGTTTGSYPSANVTGSGTAVTTFAHGTGYSTVNFLYVDGKWLRWTDPSTVDGSDVALTDTGSYFATDTAEAALQDLGRRTIGETFVLTIDDVADSMDYAIAFVDRAFTISEIRAVHAGTGLSSPDIDIDVRHSTDRSAAGNQVDTTAMTITSSTTGNSFTSGFEDATVPASSWIWVETSSKSGTTDNLEIVIRGTYD